MNQPAQTEFDVIIVGTGHAGYTLARSLRKASTDLSLLLITSDDGAWYSKPMLSNGLAKNKTAVDLASQSCEAMANTINATVLNHTRVLALDKAQKRVQTKTGDYTYQSLVLACGAQQIVLPIDGDGAADVLTVNDLEDYAQFRERLEGVERVAVMGPGLIGCEFANDLAAVGKTTVIIGPDNRPLERLVPEIASIALREEMGTLGVEWHLQTVVTHIEKMPSGYRLTLSSGETVEAGLVLSAAGLKPDIALATAAGLETNLGIVVDAQMRTSDAAIYALGDCAEISGRVMPYILPIVHAIKALTQTITGTPTAASFPRMPVVIKTPVHPVVVATPEPDDNGQWEALRDADGVRALYQSSDGELLGFVLTGGHIKEKGKLERQLPPMRLT